MNKSSQQPAKVSSASLSSNYTKKIALTVGGAALGVSGLADAGIVHWGPTDLVGVDLTISVGETSDPILWDIDTPTSTGTAEFNLFVNSSNSDLVINNSSGGLKGLTINGTSVSSSLYLANASFAPLSPLVAGDNLITFTFDLLGDVLSGWANWNFSGSDFQITEWAYCDADGCSITTGDTGASVPEPAPASLLLLGMGAAGVARWKKRKQVAAA